MVYITQDPLFFRVGMELLFPPITEHDFHKSESFINLVLIAKFEGTVAFWVKGYLFNLTINDVLFDNYNSERNHLFIRCTGSHYVQVAAQRGNASQYAAVTGVHAFISALLNLNYRFIHPMFN